MLQIPIELLLEVFQWVTDSHLPSYYLAWYHIPFHALEPSDRGQSQSSLEIIRNLSLVCRLWQQLTVHLLYRDVRISHGVNGLKVALQRITPDGITYGDLVQCAVLPFSSTVTGPCGSSRTSSSIDILKLCSRLRVLIRPRNFTTTGLRFDFEAQDVALPSLERLEWWYNNEAERSGGVNSLNAVLGNTPELTHLFIGGIAGHARMRPHSVSLPKLEALRLRSVDGLLLHTIAHHWSLPSLSHVILDTPGVSAENLQIVWNAFGSRLRTVEFGKHLRFLLDDAISSCLPMCSGLETISFFLFFTTYPTLNEPHQSLRTVRLHAAVNSYLTEPGVAWTLLEGHFNVLLGDNLPFLRKIVLYGDWRGIIAHPRFEPIFKCAQRLQRHIVYPNGMNVSH